nr:MAG TPA: stabilization protein [Caudoviricetes sp.]
MPGFHNPEILASTNVRDYGIIIYKEDRGWGIIRFKNEINKTGFKKISEFHDYGVFSIKDSKWENVHKVSVTTRYEDEDIIKLYIADGINPILVFNIAPSNESYIDSNMDIDKYKSYPKVLFSRPIFKGYISGNMKTSIVSYSY